MKSDSLVDHDVERLINRRWLNRYLHKHTLRIQLWQYTQTIVMYIQQLTQQERYIEILTVCLTSQTASGSLQHTNTASRDGERENCFLKKLFSGW